MRSARCIISVLSATVLLAAGCSGAETNQTSDAGDVAGPGVAENLTIALAADTGPLNIFLKDTQGLDGLIYDTLLAPSPYVQEPQPWLATAVRQVDPSTWEVDIRDDVTWHDGERFDVDDVVFSFGFFRDAPTGTYTHHVSEIPEISEVTATSPYSLTMSCAYPCPELGTVTLAFLPIIPEHIWAQVDPAEAKSVTALPIGTGPYELVDYDITTGYRFEANPDYFAGEPVVQELVMPVIADRSAAFTALRAGEIDATTHPLAPELLDEFSASDDLEVLQTAPLRFSELRLNFERVPFDQPEFRAAVSLAIDRQQLLDIVGLGQGRPSTQGYPHPDAPFANPDNSTPYDAEKSAARLDDLDMVDSDGDGVREGSEGPLDFVIKVNGGAPSDVRAAELVVEDLQEVGIQARVETLDAGSIAGLFASRDFDLTIGSLSPHAVADPTQFIMSHRSGLLWDAPEIPYPEFDALFEQWRATETVEDRLAVLQDMQTLFNAQPTSIPLYYPDEYWAFRSGNFAGWVESPGFGIVHKWSLLPPEVGEGIGAVVNR